MNIIKNENTEPFDVDGSLIIHQDPKTIPIGQRVEVYDAVTKKFITVRANFPMIRLLKEAHSRGFFVEVWSKGGWRWAADVVKALDLVKFVDQVRSKPLHYFDDTPVAEWLTERVYLGPDTVYKHINKRS